MFEVKNLIQTMGDERFLNNSNAKCPVEEVKRAESFVQRFGVQRCSSGGLKREDGQGPRWRTHTFLDVWRHGREERMTRLPTERKSYRPSTSINDEDSDPSRLLHQFSIFLP
jgi:hypothetical protein